MVRSHKIKLKIRLFGVLCLTLLASLDTAFPVPAVVTAVCTDRLRWDDRAKRTEDQSNSASNEFESDYQQLDALRSQPLKEVIAFADKLEAKWRRLNWNQYARMMLHVCSEILNRRVNDPDLRNASEHYARLALSHSSMFLWEHEANLVEALGYQRFSLSDAEWLRARREKVRLWLHAWHRLEEQFDPTFDVNDRKNRPLLHVWPPLETGLPPGTPPSAIKDPQLRAQYEATLAENKRKTQRANEQLPLMARGPSFRKYAEYAVIQFYSQTPFRNAELRRYLYAYLKGAAARQRILGAVEKNTK